MVMDRDDDAGRQAMPPMFGAEAFQEARADGEMQRLLEMQDGRLRI